MHPQHKAGLKLYKRQSFCKPHRATRRPDRSHIADAVTTVPADPQRLKQMLVKLLQNAIKFTPEGGAAGLEITADVGRQEVRFTVWDTGIGISPTDQARLFQPFVQLDTGLARTYEGAGLGLALVRRLAELHGGSVTVESEGIPGQGIVSLPGPVVLAPPSQPGQL
jgi:signal transduction histidine kinase